MATQKFLGTKKPLFSTQTEGLPLLPGNNFQDDPLVRGSHKRAHHFEMPNGVPVPSGSIKPGYHPPLYQKLDPKADELEAVLPPEETFRRTLAASRMMNGSMANAPALLANNTSTGCVPEESMPPWLAEEVILRFSAYFKEPVPESPVETVRVRRVAILYHTEDSTIMVREIAPTNSGLSGGVLIKRHRIPNEDDTRMLSLHDIEVGGNITMYAKTFHIYSCDDTTRAYMELEGMPMEPDQEFPVGEDAFGTYAARRQATDMKPKKELNPTDMELKRHHEYGNAGRVSKPTPVEVAEAQQFYANAGKVLTFSALWDDRGSPHGDVHFLRLNYYLTDDTIELIETRPMGPTNGREPQGKLLVRQKIPKPKEGSAEKLTLLDTLKTDAIQHSTFGVKLATGYLTARDLKVGERVTIHGKVIYVYDCNEGTRRYFEENLKLPQPPSVDIDRKFKLTEVSRPRARPPPHTGIGSDADSLGSWKNLILKPPKKDYCKWADNAGKTLRFVLRMVRLPNAVIEEEGRIVLLTYHLEDDTISMSEASVRNSGVMGGKYLARQQVTYVKPDGTMATFKASDFEVGSQVEILGRRFEVLMEDESTTKLRSGVEPEPTLDDVRHIVRRLQEAVHTRFARTTEAFRAITSKSNNSIDLDEFVQFFASMNIEVKRPLAKLIFNHYDTNGDGVVDFNEFVKMMDHQPPTVRQLEASSRNLTSLSLESPTSRYGKMAPLYTNMKSTIKQVPSIHEDHIDMATRASHKKHVQKGVMRLLRDKIEQRRIDTVEVFRLLGGNHQRDCTIRKPHFIRAVREILHMDMSPEEEEVLSLAFFPGGKPLTTQTFVEVLSAKEESLQKVGDPTPTNPEMRKMVCTQSRPQISGQPVIDSFRHKIMQRGGRLGFRGLHRTMGLMDDNGNKKLCLDELRSGLSQFGLRMSVPELNALMAHLDRDGCGSVSVTELMRCVRGEMNPRRGELVSQAFGLIDLNSNGEVTLAELGRLYDPTNHPEVLAGEKTAQEVLADFSSGWDKDGNDRVGAAEFIDYYADLSAGIDNDDYFELMMRNAWHMSGGKGAAANTSCRRVLVTHKDGSQTVEELKNDLGIGPQDIEMMQQKLFVQGIRDIAKIDVI